MGKDELCDAIVDVMLIAHSSKDWFLTQHHLNVRMGQLLGGGYDSKIYEEYKRRLNIKDWPKPLGVK